MNIIHCQITLIAKIPIAKCLIAKVPIAKCPIAEIPIAECPIAKRPIAQLQSAPFHYLVQPLGVQRCQKIENYLKNVNF